VRREYHPRRFDRVVQNTLSPAARKKLLCSRDCKIAAVNLRSAAVLFLSDFTLKQMIAGAMPPVKALRVGAQQPFPSRCQIRLWRLQKQMKMIAHQAMGMHLPACLLTSLSQGSQKVHSVCVIVENCFPPIAPAHHVITRSCVLKPQRSCHDYWSLSPAAHRECP
jgi:hypothetical protein